MKSPIVVSAIVAQRGPRGADGDAGSATGDWNDLENVPDVFPPSAHTHEDYAPADVLQAHEAFFDHTQIGVGATAFTHLEDVPSAYTDAAGKLVKVNATGTGLIFGDPSGNSVSWGDIDGTIASQTDLTPAAIGAATAEQGDLAESALQPNTAITTGRITAISSSTEALRIGYSETVYTRLTEDADGFTEIKGGLSEPPVVGTATTTYTIGARSLYDVTLLGNCEFIFPTPTAGRGFTLALTQGSTGNHVPEFPSTVRWAGNDAPEITKTVGKTDVLSFLALKDRWCGFVGAQLFTLA